MSADNANAPRARSRESGQALVEAALTLPLTVFLILGTLQLFLMLHGRILAEYAVFRATRAGAVGQADCRVMTHAAIASLLPSITAVDDAAKLGAAFRARQNNRYRRGNGALDGNLDGPIVWVARTTSQEVPADITEKFDDLTSDAANIKLQTRLVFWFPLKIPFANWVMGAMFLAHYGIREYHDVDPLMPVKSDANWTQQGPNTLSARIKNELLARFNRQQYLAPIAASWSMRMMTPAVELSVPCPNSPSAL